MLRCRDQGANLRPVHER